MRLSPITLRRLGPVLLASVLACGKEPPPPPPLTEADFAAVLRQAVEAVDSQVGGSRAELIRTIYQDRAYRPVWLHLSGSTPQARDLVASVCAAETQGLRLTGYNLEELATALRGVHAAGDTDLASLAAGEIRLTRLFIDYGTDLYQGLHPSAVDSAWLIPARAGEVDSLIRQAIRGANFPEMVTPLVPRQHQYLELAQALARYRGIQRTGGWDTVPLPAQDRLKPGGQDPLVPALVRRLRATGDADSTTGMATDTGIAPSDSLRYDRRLAGAVARFQARHGLDPDSIVGLETIEAMNVPASTRVRQIELNMERYRWLGADPGPRYILVNIPDFRLYAYDSSRLALEMRVIVGKDYRNPTPVFSDTMSFLVFRPYWNVPPRIIKEEIIPLARRDPAYLSSHDYEVLRGREVIDPATIDWATVDTQNFRYLIRQKPGGQNSLGHVKFMFPNPFDVYLHDTPANNLFLRAGRNFSHGCIRVQRPTALAEYALEGTADWDPARIRLALRDTTPPQQVILKNPVPIYIVYLTAFVEDGVVQFRKDLYGHDARAIERLDNVRGEAGNGETVCEAVMGLM
ncbi:MAG: murein L,D-transpeptidase [Gemmatimonadales bacterium]